MPPVLRPHRHPGHTRHPAKHSSTSSPVRRGAAAAAACKWVLLLLLQPITYYLHPCSLGPLYRLRPSHWVKEAASPQRDHGSCIRISRRTPRHAAASNTKRATTNLTSPPVLRCGSAIVSPLLVIDGALLHEGEAVGASAAMPSCGTPSQRGNHVDLQRHRCDMDFNIVWRYFLPSGRP